MPSRARPAELRRTRGRHWRRQPDARGPAPGPTPGAAAWLVLLVCALTAPPLGAQTPAFELPPRLGPTDELLPGSAPGTTPEFELPAQPGTGLRPGGPRVWVEKVAFSGNQAIAEPALQTVAAPFLGRALDAFDLESLRMALTRFYIERGYVNSGALIPDQRIVDGLLHIDIVEGALTRLELSGNRSLDTAWLESRLLPSSAEPLHLPSLQERLGLLLEQPLIERIDARVRPGARRGEAVLEAVVEEAVPWRFDLQADNALPRSLGAAQLSILGAHRSLTGQADPLALELTLAEGLRAAGFSYQRPLWRPQTLLLAAAQVSEADVVEEPFRALDVESRFLTLQFGVRQALRQSRADSLWLELLLERRRNETFLLGRPFSFSPGVRSGVSEVSVLVFSQEWVRRSTDEVLALRSSLRFGLDALGATVNTGLPDGRFFSWRGQGQWVRRVREGRAQWVVRLEAQLSPDALLPMEKYAVGGLYSVRGYRQDVLVRDQGFAASLEYRHLLWRHAGRRLRLDLAPFLDVGGAFNQGGPTPAPELLVSAGLGLRAQAGEGLQGRLYWGHGFEDARPGGREIREGGVHFLLSGQFF